MHPLPPTHTHLRIYELSPPSSHTCQKLCTLSPSSHTYTVHFLISNLSESVHPLPLTKTHLRIYAPYPLAHTPIRYISSSRTPRSHLRICAPSPPNPHTYMSIWNISSPTTYQNLCTLSPPSHTYTVHFLTSPMLRPLIPTPHLQGSPEAQLGVGSSAHQHVSMLSLPTSHTSHNLRKEYGPSCRHGVKPPTLTHSLSQGSSIIYTVHFLT